MPTVDTTEQAGSQAGSAYPQSSKATSAKLDQLLRTLPSASLRLGRVTRAFGTTIHVTGLTARIGQRCEITTPGQSQKRLADVVGIGDGHIILYPLGTLQGVSTDSSVKVLDGDRYVKFSNELLGCVLDGTGKILKGPEPVHYDQEMAIDAAAPDALTRSPVKDVFATGVKAIDSLLTIGRGQRIGIFAMAGGGKSTLLSMLARNSSADVIVIGLVGERGREVREFIDEHLGLEGMKRAVVVVATSDRPAMERLMAAQSATAVAEGFRQQGKNVLLLIDSVTRTARALREIGLSIGEPPVRQGFPPSVFAELPRLFERAGNDDKGTLTAFYTVLVEDEDGTDPVAEETRSILDGHIVLSRAMGESGQYPAIDVLASISRVFPNITSPGHQHAAQHLRKLLAKQRDVELLVQMGEYEKGSDTLADESLEKFERIGEYLAQTPNEQIEFSDSVSTLEALFK